MKNILIGIFIILSITACEDVKESRDELKNKPTVEKEKNDKQNQGDKQNVSPEKNTNQDKEAEIVFKYQQDKNKTNPNPTGEYSYIPTGDELTDEMAYRFLNMATFGATPKLAKELREKGVVAWVDEQLDMEYDYEKQSTLLQSLKWMRKINPTFFNGLSYAQEKKLREENKTIPGAIYSIEDIMTHKQRMWKYYIYEDTYVHSAIMNNMVFDKAQLRQRVAYALSQTVIASESVDKFFLYRFTALAYYYDFLLKDAFSSYSKLLYDVSLTPAMSAFMTYNGSRKTYTNKNGQTITPDENYGRELMQLFTIGLDKLNIDGMEYSDGKVFKQNYIQKDVNELSKVFTGLHIEKNHNFIAYSNVFKPLECNMDYHDQNEKQLLGQSIPAGQTCNEDLKSAIDILVAHNSTAPFISKKLIKRLTKSNPKSAYIQRVSTVFKDSGGDLKAVVKAIFLDQDIWDDIKQKHMTKIREPYIAFLSSLRQFDIKPMKKFKRWSYSHLKYIEVENNNLKLFTGLLQSDTLTYYKLFAQQPLYSPTVFNFYSDEFTPNDNEFRLYNHVSPELEIQTSRVLANFGEKISRIFERQDRSQFDFVYDNNASKLTLKKWLRDSFTVDTSMVYDAVIEQFGSLSKIPNHDEDNSQKAYERLVEVVVDTISKRTLGRKLADNKKEIYIKYFSNPEYFKFKSETGKEEIYKKIINPIIRYILVSDDYRVN